MTDRKMPKRPECPEWSEDTPPSDWANKLEDVLVDMVGYADEVDAYYGDLLRRAGVELVYLMKCLGSTIYDERYYRATNVIADIREHLGEELCTTKSE